MTRTATTQPIGPDLTTCDREPIHIPGTIQPHGFLLVLEEPGLSVLQASANVDALVGDRVEDVLGRSLDDLLGPSQAGLIREGVAGSALDGGPAIVATFVVDSGGRARSYYAIAHRGEAGLVVEVEPASAREPTAFVAPYPLVRTFLARMERATTAEELGRLAAEEVRRITGFDRALVYRFDEDWNGTVIAEDRNDELPSYLDLRFPASDIPAQARELYRANRLRLIVDAEYRPVPIVPAVSPATGRPLDLTFAGLRSVSPVHVQYMKNMGTRASMSISILREGHLWGLISCHHKGPRTVPFEVRAACDFLGQVLSMQLAAKEHHEDYEYRIRLKSSQAKLLAAMAHEEDFVDGLVRMPDELLALAGATGAAVLHEGRCLLIGETPAEPRVRRLGDWLSERVRREAFSTDSLPEVLPEAAADADTACGLLGVSISRVHRSFVLWFRPEVIRTVKWGGDPAKPAETTADGGGALRPRRSFEIWKETVRLRSLPWRQSEVDTAADLRHAIVEIVLKKAEELAQISSELGRINRELEAFSYSVSHDLRAPFRHIVGYSELLLEEPGLGEAARRYAATIIESAQYAGTLVDNLLEFSKMGRTSLRPVPAAMGRLVEGVRREVEVAEAAGRTIRWSIGDLPDAACDPAMMKLAWRNLLANAVKYTRGRDEPAIEVRGEARPGEVVYSVRDNGVGFDMRYVDKLFGVFQRLHRMEDFEGTGIGLANVRRIVERHGGRAWAEGAVDAGATFSFSLPEAPKPDEGGPC